MNENKCKILLDGGEIVELLILYQTTKLKASADDKINLTKSLKFVFGRVENIVFKSLSFDGLFKVGIVWHRVKMRMFCPVNMYTDFFYVTSIKKSSIAGKD